MEGIAGREHQAAPRWSPGDGEKYAEGQTSYRAAGQNEELGPAWACMGAWTSDPGLGKTIDRRSKGSTRMQVTHQGPSDRKTGQSVSGLSGLICTTLSPILSCMLAPLARNPQINRGTVGIGIPIVHVSFHNYSLMIETQFGAGRQSRPNSVPCSLTSHEWPN